MLKFWCPFSVILGLLATVCVPIIPCWCCFGGLPLLCIMLLCIIFLDIVTFSLFAIFPNLLVSWEGLYYPYYMPLCGAWLLFKASRINVWLYCILRLSVFSSLYLSDSWVWYNGFQFVRSCSCGQGSHCIYYLKLLYYRFVHWVACYMPVRQLCVTSALAL